MKNILRYSLAIVVLFLELSMIHEAKAQGDLRQMLTGIIRQLQTGTLNPAWYETLVWQSIMLDTGNSGIYPKLVQLGPVQNVAVTQQVQLPHGRYLTMTAQHSNGQSIWEMVISGFSNRIELLNFNVPISPAPIPLPSPIPSPSPQPDPTPGPSPSPGDSDACKKFPNLC